LFDVTIGEIAPGGSGVGHVALNGERRAVFVGHAALGDVLRVRVDDTSARPLRGVVESLISPGSDRRTDAPCPVMGTCGGCDAMHMSEDAQRRVHASVVLAQLANVGLSHAVTLHAGMTTLGYRARARVHVDVKRGRVHVGMHEARGHAIVDTPTCVALHPELDAARGHVREMLAGATGRGEAWLSLGGALAAGEAERHAVIALSFRGELGAQFFARAEQLVDARSLAGVIVRLEDASRELRVGAPVPWSLGVDGEPLRVPPFGFAQAHEDVNALLVRHVDALVQRVASSDGSVSRRVVGDWYAGAGNFTVALARSHDVVACESNAEAVALLRENLRSRGLSATVIASPAAHAELPKKVHTLVVDPPRTGAREVLERLPPRLRNLVYVSCDAASFARDAKGLAARGFAMRSLDLFEMFPQTSHVETVALFERDGVEREAT